MSSVPSQSTHCFKHCRRLRCSESDEDVAWEANITIEDFNSVPSKKELQTASKDYTGNPSKKTAESSSCYFADRQTFEHSLVDSIVNLELKTNILQQHIQDVSLKKGSIQEQMNLKKKLFEDIIKVVEYEKSIKAVEAVVADKLQCFQSQIINLESILMQIFKGLIHVAGRGPIERGIEDIKEKFGRRSKFNEAALDSMTLQAQNFAASLIDEINDNKIYFYKLSSEDVEIMKELKNLANRSSNYRKDGAGERFYINKDKERVYQVEPHSSEYKLNVDGQREKIKDRLKLQTDGDNEFYVDEYGHKMYTKYFFEDEFGRFFINVRGERVDGECQEIKE